MEHAMTIEQISRMFFRFSASQQNICVFFAKVTPSLLHAVDLQGLLEHGANKEEKNQDGLTPRDVIPEDTDDREYLLQLLG